MTYSWNQFLPSGLAAFTFSIEVVPRVDSVNGMPAAPAAPAPAVSPSVCISRVKPVGAIPNGSVAGPPKTVVDVSTCETSLSMDGWNSTSSNACRARVRESSPSAAPSV